MKHYLLLLLISFSVSIQAQKITFEYDTAGNQIKRELIFSTNKNTATSPKDIVAVKEEDLQKFAPNDVISYYPNPVREELYLKWELANEVYVKAVHVYSFTGQKIKSYSQSDSHNSQTIPFQGYPEGVYLVVFEYSTGDEKTIKIIKK
jgi:hypothetical protein